VNTSTLTVTIDGEDREIFMSYGLLTQLARILPSLDHVALVGVDHELRDSFLAALLAKRTKAGKVTEEVSFDEVEISLEDVETLITWGQEHLLDFFLRAMRRSTDLVERRQKDGSTPSSIGTSA
jgi:acetolactate synthase small subunit